MARFSFQDENKIYPESQRIKRIRQSFFRLDSIKSLLIDLKRLFCALNDELETGDLQEVKGFVTRTALSVVEYIFFNTNRAVESSNRCITVNQKCNLTCTFTSERCERGISSKPELKIPPSNKSVLAQRTHASTLRVSLY